MGWSCVLDRNSTDLYRALDKCKIGDTVDVEVQNKLNLILPAKNAHQYDFLLNQELLDLQVLREKSLEHIQVQLEATS